MHIFTSTSAGIRRSRSSKKIRDGACHAASSNHLCSISLNVGMRSSATSAQLISRVSAEKQLNINHGSVISFATQLTDQRSWINVQRIDKFIHKTCFASSVSTSYQDAP